MNVYGDPSCTYEQFADHLMKHSPAGPEAFHIWQILEYYRVDPAVALAFFHHESLCGTSGRAAVTRSWGNIRWRPIFGDLDYPVKDSDGFCAYMNFTAGAMHFCEHLLGKDFTNNYKDKTTVELVVPTWAPKSDHNSPVDYIYAVKKFVYELSHPVEGGKQLFKVLNVAGHLRCADITEDGLCEGLDKKASALALRGMTGASGEVDFTANVVGLLSDKLNATGKFEARSADCAYHKDQYIDWAPHVVLVHHFHRDMVTRTIDGIQVQVPNGRAMMSAPDSTRAYHQAQANAESLRLAARIEGGYLAATGIPITEDNVTLRMSQLYNWCYIHESSQALIIEYGNANVDNGALYGRTDDIMEFLKNCLLEHFNLVAPVKTPPPPVVVPPAPVIDPKLAEAKRLATQIVNL